MNSIIVNFKLLKFFVKKKQNNFKAWNEGISWGTYKFSEDLFLVENIVIEPTNMD